MRDLTHIFVTAYVASVDGKIIKRQVDRVEPAWPGRPPENLHVFPKGNLCSFESYELNKDCFATFAEAKADAEKRIAKKIKAVEKTLAKLKAKSFEEPSHVE